VCVERENGRSWQWASSFTVEAGGGGGRGGEKKIRRDIRYCTVTPARPWTAGRGVDERIGGIWDPGSRIRE
jgi:hypothetical protein